MTTQIGNITQIKTADQINDAILAELAVLLGVSDQQLGSWIRTFCYSFGVEVAAFYYQLWRGARSFYIHTATGRPLELRAQDFSLIREPATPASGYQAFIGTPSAPIPAGTVVAKPASDIADQVRFVTTQAAVVGVGGFVEVPIQCEQLGTVGNTQVNDIDEMVSSVAGIDATYNASITRLGREEEDDETLRARILRTIAGLSRGTIPSIRNATIDFRVQVMTLSGSIEDTDTEIPVDEDLNLVPITVSGTVWVGSESITYAGLDLSARPHKLIGCSRGQNSTTPAAHQDTTEIREYIPGGRGDRVTSLLIEEDFSIGLVTVTIDDGTEQGADGALVSLVQGRLEGDTTDRNPGYRGGGISLATQASPIELIPIAITIATKTGYVAAQVRAAIQDRVIRATNALGIGESIYAYEVACVAQDTDGVETLQSLSVNGVLFEGDNAADKAPSLSVGVLRTNATLTIVSS